MSNRLRILYLHGFASSPRSAKAKFFKDMLSKEGLSLEIPALDGCDFEHLTITGQLHIIQTVAANDQVVLIGSSLGGYLAALHAARNPQVLRLILLAPAFCFHNLWLSSVGPERLGIWKATGMAPIFHYGERREVPLSYQLIEDAAGYEPWPDFRQRALIFHGNRDTSVPVEYSAEFVRHHPNACLFRMDSGHELADVLDAIWAQARNFIVSG